MNTSRVRGVIVLIISVVAMRLIMTDLSQRSSDGYNQPISYRYEKLKFEQTNDHSNQTVEQRAQAMRVPVADYEWGETAMVGATESCRAAVVRWSKGRAQANGSVYAWSVDHMVIYIVMHEVSVRDASGVAERWQLVCQNGWQGQDVSQSTSWNSFIEGARPQPQ
jgi:hypothetical protein